jgi:hypothetical protein
MRDLMMPPAGVETCDTRLGIKLGSRRERLGEGVLEAVLGEGRATGEGEASGGAAEIMKGVPGPRGPESL